MEFGPEIVAAIVTALGVVTAAVVAAIYAIWEWHQKNSLERQRDRMLRSMSRDNLLAAVEADIGPELFWMETWFGKKNRHSLRRKFKAHIREHGYLSMPQAVSAPTLLNVGDLKSIINLVPTELMHQISAVYKKNTALNVLLDEMRKGAYSGLTPVQQEGVVDAFFELGMQTLDSGRSMLDALESFRRREAAAKQHPYSGAPVRPAP